VARGLDLHRKDGTSFGSENEGGNEVDCIASYRILGVDSVARCDSAEQGVQHEGMGSMRVFLGWMIWHYESDLWRCGRR
jgi:hypothetical protein